MRPTAVTSHISSSVFTSPTLFTLSSDHLKQVPELLFQTHGNTTRWNKLQPPVLHTLPDPWSSGLWTSSAPPLQLNADQSLNTEPLIWTGTHTPSSFICGAGFHFIHFLNMSFVISFHWFKFSIMLSIERRIQRLESNRLLTLSGWNILHCK